MPLRDQVLSRLTVSTLLILLVCVMEALAQQGAMGLRGQVVDQLGARIVAATVTLIGGGVEVRTTTNEAGQFLFEDLAPGRYRVLAIAPGFSPYENSELELANDPTVLSIELRVMGRTDEITVTTADGFILDSDGSASLRILRGEDLNLLPDGPGGLAAALRILTVRTASPGGPEIRVDGFSGGRLPSKSSIREIRINQNPFSAEYAEPGAERVDILTKPGAEAWGGAIYSYLNDESLNSRNPFAPNRAPFQSRFFGGDLGGPIVRERASFFADLQRQEVDDNAVVNATVVSPSLKIVPFSETVLSPTRRTSYSARLDVQWNPNHTFVTRYERTSSQSDNAGFGELALRSRGFDSSQWGDIFRLTETMLFSSIVNETRFQYARDTSNTTGLESSPAIEVPGSFSGGGAHNDRSRNVQHRWDLHNSTMWSHGRHLFWAGADLTRVRIEDDSPFNFSGTRTFAGRVAPQLDANDQFVLDQNGQKVIVPISNIESFRRTSLFGKIGLNSRQIRSLGGGASQFSIAGGDSTADVQQYTGDLYFQGDWRLSTGFTLSGGLRYERQNNIQDNLNIAPRLAFAWAPGAQNLVIRGGIGVFYDRVSEIHTLQAQRLDGVTQQQYVVTDPNVLDSLQATPTPETLSNFSVPSSITRIADNLRAPRMVQTSLSIEREIPGNITLSASFMNLRA